MTWQIISSQMYLSSLEINLYPEKDEIGLNEIRNIAF